MGRDCEEGVAMAEVESAPSTVVLSMTTKAWVPVQANTPVDVSHVRSSKRLIFGDFEWYDLTD